MSSKPFVFPLSIQIALTDDDPLSPVFQKQLAFLQEQGFSGVEINIQQPEKIDTKALRQCLADNGLKMTMFASGLAARTFGMSLSCTDDSLRRAYVSKCRHYIDFAQTFGAGIIFGFFKGSTGQQPDQARTAFQDAIGQLAPYAADRQVPLLIEATNRYESTLANSLDDTWELIRGFENEYLSILPDTYHMNIEEADMIASLQKHAGHYHSIHLSDNNRFFPGLGGIDFGKVIRFLKNQDYQGGVVLEAIIQDDFYSDVEASMIYLHGITG